MRLSVARLDVESNASLTAHRVQQPTYRACVRDDACMATLYFEVEGKPEVKARPRMGRNGVYTPKETLQYEARVAEAALEAIPDGWPLLARYSVTVHAFFPDRRRRDIDNLKTIPDGLNDVVWRDDCQIVEWVVRKFVDRERPRVEVLIQTVSGGAPAASLAAIRAGL